MPKHLPLPKLPNIKTIRYAALTLMHINTSVTTIEIKNYLSRKGYLVDHSDISHWMGCLAKKEGWISSFDGRLREYRLQDSPGYDLCCEALGFSSN